MLLVGQPNIGKSVIFSILTGRYVVVSNYPGTTVEVLSGKATELDLYVIDTPGIGSIIPRSEDEMVTLRTILSDEEKSILQVGDAKNLRRTLMLTLPLAETGFPLVLDLNMADEAEKSGYRIDTAALSAGLGIPVVLTVATEKRGKEDLLDAIRHSSRSSLQITYDPRIENAIDRIVSELPRSAASRRFLALTLLAGTSNLVDEFLKKDDRGKKRAIREIISQTQSQFGDPLSQVIMETRAAHVDRMIKKSVTRREERRLAVKSLWTLERLSTHPLWGFVVLAVILFGLYQFVGVFAAGYLVDFVQEVLFKGILLPPVVRLLSHIPEEHVRNFFIGEYGQITMGLTYALAIVFPIVTAFFLAFSLLEDSGYLPRLAVMLNRTFTVMGLNGRAVIPIVLGLGCGTMATLVTRVLETRRERIIATLLLALGIPCSAQLGVILGIFSRIGGGSIFLFMAFISLQLLIVGYLASKVLPGGPSFFLTELPPFRMPRLDNILSKTYFRTKWFIREAIPYFLLGTAFLFFADVTGLLKWLMEIFSPVVVGFFDLPRKSSQAFILGFLRRDYGAAGLFDLFDQGLMDGLQAFVGISVMTLFVPCIANVFIIFKERGYRVALLLVSFVFAYAIMAGTVLNFFLRLLNIHF
ncbi:MAG: ferrous iron transport protein B [Deltaproteobacteria bacterium]|nr:ferrous iron transport protein B [Deltaproteobacteria bacterium]